MNSWDWTQYARCSEYPAEQKDKMWNLNRNAGASVECTKGRKICEGCPVRPECLATAIVYEETAGIWGGVNRRIRLHLARDAKLCKVSGEGLHATRVAALAGWIRTNPDAIDRAKAKDSEEKRKSRRRRKEQEVCDAATPAESSDAENLTVTEPGGDGTTETRRTS